MCGKDLYIALGYIKVFSSYKCWIYLILRTCVHVEAKRENGENDGKKDGEC